MSFIKNSYEYIKNSLIAFRENSDRYNKQELRNRMSNLKVRFSSSIYTKANPNLG